MTPLLVCHSCPTDQDAFYTSDLIPFVEHLQTQHGLFLRLVEGFPVEVGMGECVKCGMPAVVDGYCQDCFMAKWC